MDLSLNDFTDNVKLISQGVLYFNKEPIYMIDRVESKTEDFLFVYGVRLDNNGEPIKDYYIRERVVDKNGNPLGISGGEPISDMILRITKKRKEKYTEDKPELYVAPVVEFEDSLSKEFGLGFFLRTPDEIDYDGRVTREGEATGVFTLLSNIEWYNKYIPIDGIIEEYRYKLEEREYLRERGDSRL